LKSSEPGSVGPPRRHLGAGAALSVIADVGPLVSVGVLSIVLARAIGPSGNGTYALIATLVNVAVLIFSLGLSAGITYEVSRGTWPAAQALRETYRLALVLGIAGTAAGLGFYELTRDSVLKAVDPPLAVIAAATVPVLLASQFAAAILLGRDRYEGYAALLLTISLVILVAAAGLAVPFGLTGAVAGFAASGVIGAVAGAVLIHRANSRPQSRPVVTSNVPGERPLARAFHFGLRAWVANLLQQVNYRFDVMILAAYASVTEVGVYSVALTLTSVAWILPHGLQMVIFPRTASLDAAAQAGHVSDAESDAAVARATRHSVLLLPPAGLLVAALLAIVPLVYGHSFDQTVALGFVLLPGVLALGAGKVLGTVVAGRGEPRYNLYTGLIAAVITLALYFTLIPAYGEWGAAVASSISYLATTVIAAAFFRRVVGIPLADALVPTTADLRNYREAFDAFRAHFRSRRARRQAA
jgi:O-antigen/teichoic acid export membrane protein